MASNLISVIIPAFNAEKTIELTLSSVFNQTYSPLEILVVNDGSTDGTLAILEKFESKIKIITIENKGVSNARNVGLANSKGNYIQFLDADDLLIENKIEIQHNALMTTNADVAYGNWETFVEENGIIKCKQINNKTLSEDIELHIFTDFWCPPAALLYSKRIVTKIGPWKEWLPIIQDARYMLDAALSNGKFVYCSNLVAKYRTGSQNSLSNQNSLAFVKDIFNNTKDVWSIWQKGDGNAQSKKEAVIKSLRYCIHEFSKLDKKLFNEAIDYLLKINPKYIPPQFGMLKLLSILFSYKTAEKIAAIKRKLWR